jgi:hypothetical protein
MEYAVDAILIAAAIAAITTLWLVAWKAWQR